MENKNCQLLLDYLHQILQGNTVVPLSKESLDGSCLEMYEGLETLHEHMEYLAWQAETIEGYNELLVELTRKRSEWIMVVDALNKDILYCNKRMDNGQSEPESCEDCESRLSFRQRILDWHDPEDTRVWEFEEECSKEIHQITSFPLEWKGKKAYAHVIKDITAERRRAQRLTKKAYLDPGTGIYNRFYFEETMERLLLEQAELTLCYMDLDGLKYVNDNFGHMEGDHYISSFVETIRKNFRTTDVFARVGGDEFGLILPRCSEERAREKMEAALKEFVEQEPHTYPKSFSYGLAYVGRAASEEDVAPGRALDALIRIADAAMYDYKKENKKKYHGDSLNAVSSEEEGIQ